MPNTKPLQLSLDFRTFDPIFLYFIHSYKFIIMRRSLQENSNHHDLIRNYKQDDTSPTQMLPIWAKTWQQFEQDILSYVLPAIQHPRQAMLD